MSYLSIDQNAGPSLAILVESVMSPLLMAHPAPVCLEVDIPAEIQTPADADQTAAIVQSITRQMLATLPSGGDVLLTACVTEKGVELEFADNGPDVSERSCSRPLAVAQAGAVIHWQNCPQGGAAATVTFPVASQSSQSTSHKTANHSPTRRKAA